MKENITFISPLYDTTFKYLWKKKSSRDWFIKLIELITHIDLGEYTLYDPELNSGNKLKDYRLDILFLKGDCLEKANTFFNIEMYKEYREYSTDKSHSYVFRLLGYSYKEGEDYKKRKAIQLNFINKYCPYDKDICITQYMLRDKENNLELEDLIIYDVYLPICKDVCYNKDDELSFMLAFLQANSFDEMKRLAKGNKEALNVKRDLEDLIMEDKFMGVYNNEIEQKKIRNTERYYGLEEGKEIGRKEGKEETKKEAAINFMKNGVSLELISKSLGMSINELEQIKKDNL